MRVHRYKYTLCFFYVKEPLAAIGWFWPSARCGTNRIKCRAHPISQLNGRWKFRPYKVLISLFSVVSVLQRRPKDTPNGQRSVTKRDPHILLVPQSILIKTEFIRATTMDNGVACWISSPVKIRFIHDGRQHDEENFLPDWCDIISIVISR